MYSVSVVRDFIAQHFLFGGEWGSENHPHSHHYKVEVCLRGKKLDEHGYLVDIVDIENTLEELVGRFKDKQLNELPEFNGLNPSIENFSRIFCQEFLEKIIVENLDSVTVKIWENDVGWASFYEDFENS